MTGEQRLAYLLDLAESLGLEVRNVTGRAGDDRAADLVTLKGCEILFVDTAAPAAVRAQAVGRALRGRDGLDQMFLPPEIRSAIDGDDSEF